MLLATAIIHRRSVVVPSHHIIAELMLASIIVLIAAQFNSLTIELLVLVAVWAIFQRFASHRNLATNIMAINEHQDRAGDFFNRNKFGIRIPCIPKFLLHH
jgi:hypothetical protein